MQSEWLSQFLASGAPFLEAVQECALWGSRSYGTAAADGDFDILVVVADGYPDSEPLVSAQGERVLVRAVLGALDVTLAPRRVWRDMCLEGRHDALELLYAQPQHRWVRQGHAPLSVPVDKDVCRRTSIFEARRRFGVATDKMQLLLGLKHDKVVEQVETWRKDVTHAHRYLLFARSVIECGTIRDFGAANAIWQLLCTQQLTTDTLAFWSAHFERALLDMPGRVMCAWDEEWRTREWGRIKARAREPHATTVSFEEDAPWPWEPLSDLDHRAPVTAAVVPDGPLVWLHHDGAEWRATDGGSVKRFETATLSGARTPRAYVDCSVRHVGRADATAPLVLVYCDGAVASTLPQMQFSCLADARAHLAAQSVFEQPFLIVGARGFLAHPHAGRMLHILAASKTAPLSLATPLPSEPPLALHRSMPHSWRVACFGPPVGDCAQFDAICSRLNQHWVEQLSHLTDAHKFRDAIRDDAASAVYFAVFNHHGLFRDPGHYLRALPSADFAKLWPKLLAKLA